MVEDTVQEMLRPPWEGPPELTGRTLERSTVRLLCPVVPSKIVACGINYRSHLAEARAMLPHHDFSTSETDLVFGLRAPSALNDPEAPIRRPPVVQRLDHEAELGVVIGRKTKRVLEMDALEAVLGYTCYNDCGARDIQAKGSMYAQKAKAFDTFGCCGPWIVTEGVDLQHGRIECRINGVLRQSAALGEMMRSVPSLIAEISMYVTLFPGDLILTGSPAGVSPMSVGDTVEVSIDGIGTLRNHVEADMDVPSRERAN